MIDWTIKSKTGLFLILVGCIGFFIGISHWDFIMLYGFLLENNEWLREISKKLKV